ncbi:nucleotide sugar dehydrogenase (plasmid) [Haloferax sp. S1W]|uniref:nucleotide sugar dehydrogenase n=1 Tax=Haloferax sp. S1W TaxID=3377110 RepID=UPI0037C5BFA9
MNDELLRDAAEPLYGATRPVSEQRRDFLEGRLPVAVYGLGKMGLPLATVYAETTGNVIGVDIDDSVVDQLNRGMCHIDGEPELPALVSELVDTGSFTATTEVKRAASAASIHVIIVPTLLSPQAEPDLSALEAAARGIASGIDPGDQIIVECTVPPGTSTDRIVPLVAAESGVHEGEFGVAFCPERTSSGRALQDIRGAYPKIVGGVDAESTRVAELIYGELTTNDIITMSDATTAEAVKVFEGVYRDVNIALANELAQIGDDLGFDANAAIEAANTQPYCDIHTPGPGVGGHCIPYYPYFLTSQTSADTPLLRTAREVNDGMPSFVVSKLTVLLQERGIDVDGSRLLVLGLTYRPGVAETRATPAKPIVDSLVELGGEVFVCDPILNDVSAFGGTPVDLNDISTLTLDGVVVVTPHDEFDAIDWDAFDDVVIIDGRNTLDLPDRPDRHVYTIGGR